MFITRLPAANAAFNAICSSSSSSSSREQQRWVGVRASMQQQQQLRRGGRGKTARVTDCAVTHYLCRHNWTKKELNYRRTPAVPFARWRHTTRRP